MVFYVNRPRNRVDTDFRVNRPRSRVDTDFPVNRPRNHVDMDFPVNRPQSVLTNPSVNRPRTMSTGKVLSTRGRVC